ncbi:bifunctional 5,10-methylenetetrahydrofolate dehydrogenase/5,10-methenyltetrahydrofolate cyclohydrolase [Patescibacteria group bacterium]|nr:bifunctional 5,10-methylenetetrahydrofolate dehydrogenase/5,10-methenyltetrahydrofolate cyclohydrolase [Patescibacteria group bacterium]
MKIDGKKIADKILKLLKKKTEELCKKNITPHLAIILIGNDPASSKYVEQKIDKAKLIGIETSLFHLEKTDENQMQVLIEDLNKNLSVNGIIIQRPLPENINENFARNIINKAKDVDGFLKNSKFSEPIAEAVLEILKTIHVESKDKKSFNAWLKNKTCVVVGKGDTGGRPIINLFKKLGITLLVVDSKTKNPRKIIKKANILISTVGKPIIFSNEVKKGAIVIGIGMHKGKNDKLYPDYNQKEIAEIASFYTPVPGGVGPVNVAMLLRNVIEST